MGRRVGRYEVQRPSRVRPTFAAFCRSASGVRAADSVPATVALRERPGVPYSPPGAAQQAFFHRLVCCLLSCGLNGALLRPLKTSLWEASKPEGSLEVPAQVALCASGTAVVVTRRSREPSGTKQLVGKDDSRRPIADPD